jgi:hypothetical protein
MATDSPWPLRFDLISAKALVGVAGAGREAELTREAHANAVARHRRGDSDDGA